MKKIIVESMDDKRTEMMGDGLDSMEVLLKKINEKSIDFILAVGENPTIFRKDKIIRIFEVEI